MTLGENIARLRNERRLSQGDLAERMNVSRQSVSKWETDSSIPDLDKLILLSDLFEISLDELVKNAPAGEKAPQAPALPAAPASGKPPETQRVIGFILLAVGLLSWLIFLLFGPALAVLSLIVILCGILCLTARRWALPLVGWVVPLPILLFLPFITSISLSAVLKPYYYQNGLWIQLFIAFVLWFFLLGLVYATVRQTRLRGHIRLLLGWAVFSQVGRYLPFAFGFGPQGGTGYDRVMPWAVLLFLILLLILTARAVFTSVHKGST